MMGSTNEAPTTLKDTAIGCLLFFIVLVVAFFALKSCMFPKSTKTTSNGKTSITVDEIAKQNNAYNHTKDGNSYTAYNFETNEIGANGTGHTISGLTVTSVKVEKTFLAGTEQLNNVVVLEVDGISHQIKEFLSDHATLFVIDENNNINEKFGSAYYRDSSNNKLYMLFDNEGDISKYKYAILGGFEKDKNNGFSNIMFEIN